MTGRADQRNLLLVSIDSLRADHCSYLPGGRDETPTLERLAKDGIACNRAIAPGPSTPEAMPATFTGHYPVEWASDGSTGLARTRVVIRRHMGARISLTERLARRGYQTAAFTPNPFTSRYFGFEAGFDEFQDFMGAAGSAGGMYGRVFERFLRGGSFASMARVMRNLWRREEVFKPWESYFEELEAWIDAAEEPWFAWVFLMDAHNPYLPGAAYRSQSWLAQTHGNYRFWRNDHETPFSPRVHERFTTAYRDAVRYADGFLDRAETAFAGEEPVTIVHGDHGEAFGEHGSYGHEPYLHPENVHVPLVIGGLGSREVARPVSLRRLPEIVEMASDGSAPDPLGRPFAVTRTDRGQDAAVYTEDTYYTRRGGSPGQLSTEASDLLERLLVADDTCQREHRYLVEAATEVTRA